MAGTLKDLYLTGLVFVLLIVLDAGYLTLRQDYHDRLFQAIQQSPLRIRYGAAALVYVVLAAALVLGALRGATSVRSAAMAGAVIGFIMYVFYDLTNMATLTRYTWEMVAVDSVWGGVLSAATAGSAFWIARKLKWL